MDKNQNQGNLWFGLLFAAAGAIVMLASLDIIHSPDENFHAPRWVVLIAGVAFFGGGIFIALLDPSFEGQQEKWWFRTILKISQLAIPFSLLVVLNWVAFAPGEREFSSSVSIPFLTFSTQNSSEIMGRCVFGSMAIISDIVLVFVLIKGFQHQDDN